MPGTLVTDALAVDLLSGLDLDGASTQTGTAVEVNKPGDVAFVLTTTTVTGADASIDIEIQGSDASGFGSGVVSYGHFDPVIVTDDNVTRVLNAKVYKRYVRAVVILGGTAPVCTGSTVYTRQPHLKRTSSTTA